MIVQMREKRTVDGYARPCSKPKNCKVECDIVSNKFCFYEKLRVEIQRSQRSKTPLSIILLTESSIPQFPVESVQGLLGKLNKIIRETDMAGYVNPNTIGVLLPYTDYTGALKISEKIKNKLTHNSFNISSSTYPNQVFESLADSGCVSPDVLALMFDDDINHSSFHLKIKRGIDVVGSILALLTLSPLMLLTALLIKADSRGPIIFKQTRLGFKGRPFVFYKFRSMRTGMSDQIHRDFVLKLIHEEHANVNVNKYENSPYKIKSDPRVTWFGKFIRKTSIDELPQLLNVIRGDMSLVGPRPPLPYEVEKYQSWHLRRILDMKPGITGLWQVEGRSRTKFNDAVRLDVRYIQTWSLMLDLKILVKTVWEVLRCRGAV